MDMNVSADRCCIAHTSPAHWHHVAALSPWPQHCVAVLELGSAGAVRAAEWCHSSAFGKLQFLLLKAAGGSIPGGV